jgi:hypothetical protein
MQQAAPTDKGSVREQDRGLSRRVPGSLPASQGGNGGRPKMMKDGQDVGSFLPRLLIEQIDSLAASHGTTRASTIRRLLEKALG